MNVNLKIENDTELRAYIKDCIKGQVLSIVRDEFLGIVKEELNRKTKNFEAMNFDYMVQSAVKDIIRDILYNKFDISRWNDDYIKPHIIAVLNERVNASLAGKNWNELVDYMAKEKVKALIK